MSLDTVKRGKELVIDMAKGSYMDSAALGMLSLLREQAQKKGGRVTIVDCQGQAFEHIASLHRISRSAQ